MAVRWFGQSIGVLGQLTVRGAAFSYSIDVSQDNYVQFSSGFVSVTGVQARMSYDAGDDRLVTYDAAATWQYYVTRADLKTVSANINVAAVAFPVAQTAHGFVEGTPLNETASGYVVADNTDPAKNCDVIVAVVVDANNFIAIQAGKLTLTTGQWDAICGTSGGLTKGENYWLGGAGTMTATQPTTYLQPLIKALSTTEALVAIGDIVANTGNPSVERLGKVVCSGSQATITFSSIPQTHTDLKIVLSGRATGAVAAIGVYIKFNNDGTAGNYLSAQEAVGQATVMTAQQLASTTNGSIIGYAAGTTNTAHPLTNLEVLIPNYTGSTFEKGYTSLAMLNHLSNTATSQVQMWGGQWIGTPASISRIDLTIASGSFMDGTTATLYGVG